MSQRRPIFKIAWTRPICTHCLFVVLQLNICNKHNLFSFLSDILFFFIKIWYQDSIFIIIKKQLGFFLLKLKKILATSFQNVINTTFFCLYTVRKRSSGSLSIQWKKLRRKEIHTVQRAFGYSVVIWESVQGKQCLKNVDESKLLNAMTYVYFSKQSLCL